jgi:hypothetical protein
VFMWDGDTAYDITGDLPNSNVLDIFYNGENLIVGLDAHRIHTFDQVVDPTNAGTYTGYTWTERGATYGDSTDNFSAQHFALAFGAHWHAQKGGNLVHYWYASDADDAETGINVSSTDWDHPQSGLDYDPLAIECGPGGREVVGLLPWNGVLLVFRRDSIGQIYINEAGEFSYKEIKNYSDSVRGNNFNAFTGHAGAVFFGAADVLEYYTIDTESNYTPPAFTEEWPPETHNQVQALYSIHGHLFAVLDSNLYSIPGQSNTHHRLESDMGFGADSLCDMIYYPGYPDYGVLALAAVHEDDGYVHLYHWRMEDQYARAPYVDEGWLEISRIDGGFVSVPKYLHDLHIYGHVPAAGGTIEVRAYVHDLATNTTQELILGTITAAHQSGSLGLGGAGSSRWSRALSTLEFPRDTVGSSVILRFTIRRASDEAAASPVWYGYLLEYVLRPPTIYGYAPVILISENNVDQEGWRLADYPQDALEFLERARASTSPVYYEDYFGHRGWAFLSTITESENHRNPTGETPEINISLSVVSLTQECVEIVIPDGEVVEVETAYRVVCGVKIEGTGVLRIVNEEVVV